MSSMPSGVGGHWGYLNLNFGLLFTVLEFAGQEGGLADGGVNAGAGAELVTGVAELVAGGEISTSAF
jgi:hypothetical protein